MVRTVGDNWLSTVDVGTYKWTLYVVKNSLYNDPGVLSENDTAALNNGDAIIIAESGVTGSYAIENVIIQSTISTGRESSHAIPTGIVFEIYEPLGFSLLDRLLTVGKMFGNPQNITSLSYVMKLEFQGRDGSTGANKKFPGVFLWPMRIGAMRGSLGPAGAKYFIEASFIILTSQTEETVTRTDVVVESVSTVETFATNLEAALNQAERDLMSPREIQQGRQPLREFVVQLGNTTNIQADPDRRISPFDLGPQPWAGTADAGTASAESANTVDVDVRDIVINSETQLTAKITELLEINVPTWSTYVIDARDNSFFVPVIYTNIEHEILDEIDTFTNQFRRRTTITVEIRMSPNVPAEDPGTRRERQTSQDYQQERFDALDILKKYNYLYTAENTEVLEFQLEVENLFFQATAPAAGIYYSDNNQQFTPTNPVPVTFTLDGTELTSAQAANLGVTFLSDITPVTDDGISRIDIPFERIPAAPSTQQKNEHTGLTDDIAAVIAQQTARRNTDNQVMMLEIRGDPFWLGTPDNRGTPSDNRFIGDFTRGDALIGFVNFQPNVEDLLVNQRRGPVDLISTGVYVVTQIESKFQMGQFTQTLTTFKDPNTNPFLILDQLINIEVV